MLTLQTQTSVKDIRVSILGDYWPDADREKFPLGVQVLGKIMNWTRVADGKIKIMWPDGYDMEYMSNLLAPAFKFTLVASATGGPVARRGGTHGVPPPGQAAQVPAAKEKVVIPYKIGTLNFAHRIPAWQGGPRTSAVVRRVWSHDCTVCPADRAMAQHRPRL